VGRPGLGLREPSVFRRHGRTLPRRATRARRRHRTP
jgi:hypothetical protein